MIGFVKFVAFSAIGSFCLLLAVVASDQGPWYFAWLLGTMMIILLSVAGGVMFETQFAEKKEQSNREKEDKA
ncbi:hypothetical protein [Thioclava sp.]|uniref:hypothetical protein n=1 Tax=Thioclava sp. TaxID=1933450 RepID=UPI003AA962A2